MSEEVKEKIWCMQPNSNTTAETLALMNSGGANSAWNNPFIYLVWMMLFRNGAWGNGEAGADYNSRQIAALQDSINTNHNNDLTIQAINGNANAIQQLATTLNCDFNSVQMAICNVKSAIEKVGGDVNYSAERVINAANLGNMNIIQNLKDCCCSTQKEIIKGNYENQLANERQTANLNASIESNRQAVVNGFANVGYQSSQNTAAIIQAGNANTQRVIDTMNNHWNSELQIKYQDAKAELSQSQQTNALTAQLTVIAAAIAKIPTT